jgi:hypothetical protein
VCIEKKKNIRMLASLFFFVIVNSLFFLNFFILQYDDVTVNLARIAAAVRKIEKPAKMG